MSAPKPGSAEWLQYMTASKIAAVVGTSPYESRFSLWHRMHGDLGPQEQTDAMTYGHYLEPVLLQWFADKHPEFRVNPGRWVTHEGWAGATPDGIFSGKTSDDEGLVQCKTSRLGWEWSNGVPPGYYDQVQWEMWVTAEKRVYVVADIEMQFREFLVERDEDRIAYLVSEADAFMASLKAGTPPPLDGSTHTYQAIRELHPEIDPEDFDVPDDLAAEFLTTFRESATATERHADVRNRLFAAMGTARRAVWNDAPILRRQARGGGTPFAVTPTSLPPLEIAS